MAASSHWGVNDVLGQSSVREIECGNQIKTYFAEWAIGSSQLAGVRCSVVSKADDPELSTMRQR